MLFSVSVDLDGLGCYAAIHGLDPAGLDDRALRAVPEVALGRFCDLFDALGVRSTLFVVGAEAPIAPAALARAAGQGHEIASHSYAHEYAMSRWTEQRIALDLERAEEAIRAASGTAPRGFRAPGYTLSPALLAALRARGYAYDSSLFPSPPYYAAKAAAIALHAARGRRSRSILGGVAQLFARRGPHRLDGVRELPIATLPLVRAPVIGTLVTAVAERVGAVLARAASAGGHVNLQLHGIDALDGTDGPPRELSALQPGLRIPAALKLRRLRAALQHLRDHGAGCTLEEAARRLLPGAD
jgi:hypothetical protein